MDNTIALIIVIAVSVVLFIITREFWCWYWKINKKLRTLESIDRRLEDLQNQIMNQSGGSGYPPIDSESPIYKPKDDAGRDNPYRNE